MALLFAKALHKCLGGSSTGYYPTCKIAHTRSRTRLTVHRKGHPVAPPVAVALPFSVRSWGRHRDVLRSLCLQQMPERHLDNSSQASWIVEQHPLQLALREPTTTLGHRLASIDGSLSDTNYPGGRWHVFASGPPIYTSFTEIYGRNPNVILRYTP
jgi:hypothetical protein